MKKAMREKLMAQAATEITGNIVEYVRENYDALPKSNFNKQEVVVVLEIANEDWGYGHHSYSGVAVDREGKIWYGFSSGCSCNGDCGLTEQAHGHDTEFKKFEVDGQAFDLTDIDPERLQHIQVSFSDY